MANEIDIQNLKIITNTILDHIIEDLKKSKVKLKKDGYWDIPKDQLFDLRKDPTTFEVGRLSDDWEFLSSILRDKSQAVSYMLVHLAPIIKYIGNEIGQ